MKLIRMTRPGGPEVLEWQEAAAPEPGAGEVLIAHSAIGVNFIDVYHRSGLYPLALPAVPGLEAAGRVVSVGAEASGFAPGDRVACCSLPPGAYAEKRVVRADRLVKLPPGIDERTAAASMLKGLTAWYLLRRSYPVKTGDTVLLYAAAGGVGLILAQWALSLGVRVIGVAGSPEKAAMAQAHGCAEVLASDAPDFVARVRELTGGAGVAAVYDSIGRDTFMQSLDCLRPHGVMVSFGNASGPVAAFSPMELSKRGSLYLTRPTLFDFIAARSELEAGTIELFERIAGGHIRIHIGQTYPLREAARAHADLEARRTTGSTLLLP